MKWNLSEADTFAELVEQLAEETIQINQGGPESKYGVLLGMKNDFLHLYTEDDGIVYFNIHHIKSVSKYQNNNNNDNNNNNNNNQQQVVYPDTIDASDFGGVFKHLEHKWVSINRGGPEAMEGVLVENAGGHYTLVSNEEVLRVHPYHIRSISAGAKGSLQNNNQNNNHKIKIKIKIITKTTIKIIIRQKTLPMKIKRIEIINPHLKVQEKQNQEILKRLQKRSITIGNFNPLSDTQVIHRCEYAEMHVIKGG